MRGSVKRLIDELVRLRSRGNAKIVPFVRAHLVLNGIDPDAHTENTADEADKIAVLEGMIRDFQRR